MSAKPFAATGAATGAAAVIGAVATDVDSRWYRGPELRPAAARPGYRPGLDRALYLDRDRGRARLESGQAGPTAPLATVLGINLCLNAAWPWVSSAPTGQRSDAR